jgi:mono/diheme cytochrome c family protein
MRAGLSAGLIAAGLAFAALALTSGIGGGSEPARQRQTAAVGHDSGRAVFARMGCGSCHTLAAAGSRGELGPDLDERLPGHTRASLVERITRGPAADGTFSPMPDNFRDRLDDDELDALVDFLLAARSVR